VRRGNSRRGFTMIELLVAMALTGIVVTMVGQWILHEVKAQISSDRKIDVDEAVASLRAELFQDVHHGRILSLGKEKWLVLRPDSSADPDTVVWSWHDGALTRTDRAGSSGRLTGLAELQVAWEPVPVVGFSGFGNDSWWSLDADQNGWIEGYELDSVQCVAVHIKGEFRTLPGLPTTPESLTVRIPSSGL